MSKRISQQAHTLSRTKGIPVERAQVKVESTNVGKAAAFGGGGLMFVAALLVLAPLLQGNPVTLFLLLGAMGVGAMGLFLFGVGMSLISRDVSDVIARIGDVLVKLVRAVRGRGNGHA